MYSDVRPSYFNLSEPRTSRRMFENIGLESSCKQMRGAAVEADAIGVDAIGSSS